MRRRSGVFSLSEGGRVRSGMSGGETGRGGSETGRGWGRTERGKMRCGWREDGKGGGHGVNRKRYVNLLSGVYS